MSIHAPAYAYFVHLTVPHENTWFSDNYFDIEAGQTRKITVRNADVVLTPKMVEVKSR